MLVVTCFCRSDADLMIRNLRWCQELDGGPVAFDCLLSYDQAVSTAELAAVEAAAGNYFSRVQMLCRSNPPVRQWPKAQNHAFQATARHVEDTVPADVGCWFWWEPDAIPVVPGWLSALAERHAAGGKPVSSHVHSATGVANGVAVYPRDFASRLWAQGAMMAINNPWDANWTIRNRAAKTFVNPINDIYQHVWNVREDGTPCGSETGAPASFPNHETVKRIVRSGVKLFHRNKDGTLIDRLREQRNV